MKKSIYLIVLADRMSGILYIVDEGKIVKKKSIEKDDVPRKVKHGENTWDAQDKILRHIDEHVKRHLEKVAAEALRFANDTKISGIIIGGHKQLFEKVKSEFKYPYSKKILGEFVTELKADQGEILKRITKKIESLEKSREENLLQKALS